MVLKENDAYQSTGKIMISPNFGTNAIALRDKRCSFKGAGLKTP